MNASMASVPSVKKPESGSVVSLSVATDSAGLRRRPRQARAVERFERILDTAEQVFAEVGFDSATTNLIATQAGTSVGSLYEFFPNKAALAVALADRYTERIGSLYETLIVDKPDMAGPELIARVVEALDSFYREHPGAVPLLNGRLTSEELAGAGASLQRAMVVRIEAVIKSRRKDLPAPRRQLVAQVIAEMARSLLVLADQVPLHQRHAVVREIERAIIGYLATTFPEFQTIVNDNGVTDAIA
jgi:AcrR family transcriptional regulator